MPSKIGIFGGTFNPIHNGHLMIAQYAMEECNLSEVIFLPNGNPPHKNADNLADAIHRLNMVKLAVSDCLNFSVSDYEIKREESSYTVDTNAYLKTLYNCPLYFIIGADSLYTLNKWKSPERLIKECRFIVADRLCKDVNDVRKECERLNSLGGDFTYLSMPRYDISSTELRKEIYDGNYFTGHIPANVIEYIIQNELYKS